MINDEAICDAIENAVAEGKAVVIVPCPCGVRVTVDGRAEEGGDLFEAFSTFCTEEAQEEDEEEDPSEEELDEIEEEWEDEAEEEPTQEDPA